MNEESMLVTAAPAEAALRRKPWQMPQIEDVSVALATAKKSSNAETSTTKTGS